MTRPRHVLFIDESGNHAMDYAKRPPPSGDRDLFVLCGCLCRVEEVQELDERVDSLKRRFGLPTETAITSRRIRKREGAFAFLNDSEKRESFLRAVSDVVAEAPFIAFAVVIDKWRHWQRYQHRAAHPYDLSLQFMLERVCVHAMRADASVQVIAESRGRREDAELRLEYERILRDGTSYGAAAHFRRTFEAPMGFRRKADNVAGLQLADLVAYPIHQRLRYPDSRYPSFEAVSQKLDRTRHGRLWGAGLKVFPDANASDFGL